MDPLERDYCVFAVEPPVFCDVLFNGCNLLMEVDSGSAFTVVNPRVMRQLRISKSSLRPCTFQLRSYTRQSLRILGKATADVSFKGKSVELELLVVKGFGVSLLGRDWFRSLGISLEGVNHVDASLQHVQAATVHNVMDEFSELFQARLGRSKGPPVRYRPRRESQVF